MNLTQDKSVMEQNMFHNDTNNTYVPSALIPYLMFIFWTILYIMGGKKINTKSFATQKACLGNTVV